MRAATEKIEEQITQGVPFTIREFLAALHDGLPPAIEIEYVAGLRRFASIYSGRIYNKASACAGTEIRVKLDMVFWEFLCERYGIEVDVQHAWASEIKDDKQMFLRSQFPELKQLFGDMADVASDSATNLLTAELELIPETSSLSVGVPCTSRTPQSSSMQKNLNCVQEKREATGVSFDQVEQIARAHSPDDITMECVTQLCQMGPKQTLSDADFMTKQLAAMGYWGLHHTMDAEEQGGWTRIREWWVNAKHMVGNRDEISAHYKAILSHLRLPQRYFDVSKCITICDKQRRQEGKALNIPLMIDHQ